MSARHSRSLTDTTSMHSEASLNWADIPSSHLDIPLTLTSGQTFGWRRIGENRWLGAIEATAVLLEPGPSGFGWATWPEDRWDVIHRYFALDIDLDKLYKQWVTRDPTFERLIQRFRGLRILRQNPETALCVFVCSSCNNVPRIAGMVRSLTLLAGRRIPAPWQETVYAEPNIEDACQAGENALRQAGFGYRAKYLAQMGEAIKVHGPRYIGTLARLDWSEARDRLNELPGVGPKVADCVGLCGMAVDDAVPVDRHVRRYVVSRLRPDLEGKPLSVGTYSALASAFRGIMGPFAGWAQQYVFMAARYGRPSDWVLEVEP